LSGAYPIRPGDHRIGDSHLPGHRYYDLRDASYIAYKPVKGGVHIALGDIITIDSDGYLQPFETNRRAGARRKNTAGTAYEAKTQSGIANLTNGVFQALAPCSTVDAAGTSYSDGDVDLPVYRAGAYEILYAEAGMRVGDLCEVDTRADTTGASATTRATELDAADTATTGNVQIKSTSNLTGTTRRQRVRAIEGLNLRPVLPAVAANAAITAGDALTANVLGYGYVGVVAEIVGRRQSTGAPNAVTQKDDTVLVQLGEVQAH